MGVDGWLYLTAMVWTIAAALRVLIVRERAAAKVRAEKEARSALPEFVKAGLDRAELEDRLLDEAKNRFVMIWEPTDKDVWYLEQDVARAREGAGSYRGSAAEAAEIREREREEAFRAHALRMKEQAERDRERREKLDAARRQSRHSLDAWKDHYDAADEARARARERSKKRL